MYEPCALLSRPKVLIVNKLDCDGAQKHYETLLGQLDNMERHGRWIVIVACHSLVYVHERHQTRTAATGSLIHCPKLPKENCIGEVVRISSIIIFRLSKL